MPNVDVETAPDVSEKMAELGFDVITEFGGSLDDCNPGTLYPHFRRRHHFLLKATTCSGPRKKGLEYEARLRFF